VAVDEEWGWFAVGGSKRNSWGEINSLCWVSYLNPTYEADSSFHRFVRDGCYPLDRGAQEYIQFPPNVGNE